MAQFVGLERQNGVAVIEFNRPPANSYNLQVVRELGEAVAEVRFDSDLKAAVVLSALEKFFSAGADIKSFQESSPGQNRRMIGLAHEVLRNMERSPQVFIAAINGHALGGGLEIALACDLRLAAEGDYKLGLPEVTLGLLPGNGGTQRLPRLIGKSRALDLMLSGRAVGPQEAYELGIVNRLVPADALREEAIGYGRRLAEGATLAQGLIKTAVQEGTETSLSGGLALERELIGRLFYSEDAREGLAAFTEKRKPAFKGH